MTNTQEIFGSPLEFCLCTIKSARLGDLVRFQLLKICVQIVLTGKTTEPFLGIGGRVFLETKLNHTTLCIVFCMVDDDSGCCDRLTPEVTSASSSGSSDAMNIRNAGKNRHLPGTLYNLGGGRNETK